MQDQVNAEPENDDGNVGDGENDKQIGFQDKFLWTLVSRLGSHNLKAARGFTSGTRGITPVEAAESNLNQQQ